MRTVNIKSLCHKKFVFLTAAILLTFFATFGEDMIFDFVGPTDSIWITKLFCYGDSSIIAASNRTALYISPNNGNTWDTLTDTFPYEKVKCINSINGVLYLAFFSSSSGPIFKKSFDMGKTWQNTNLNASNIYTITNINTTIFAGGYDELFYSYDEGDSWTRVPMASNMIAELLNFYGDLYAATNVGMQISHDSGKTWGYVPCGSTSATNISIKSIGNTLIGSGEYGVKISEDSGKTWKTTLSTFQCDVYCYVVDTVIVALAKPNGILGYHKSIDSGKTWQAVNLYSSSNEKLYFEDINGTSKYYFISTAKGVYRCLKNEETSLVKKPDGQKSLIKLISKNCIRIITSANNNITCDLFACTGRKICTLFDSYSFKENLTINFRDVNLCTGVYFLKIKMNQNSYCRRVNIIL